MQILAEIVAKCTPYNSMSSIQNALFSPLANLCCDYYSVHLRSLWVKLEAFIFSYNLWGGFMGFFVIYDYEKVMHVNISYF